MGSEGCSEFPFSAAAANVTPANKTAERIIAVTLESLLMVIPPFSVYNHTRILLSVKESDSLFTESSGRRKLCEYFEKKNSL